MTEKAAKIAARLRSAKTKSWTIMEICSGQSHSLLQYRLLESLPETITILHGPGSPLSVTPLSFVDKALSIAKYQNVIFCATHELLRVRGSKEDLLDLKAQGFDIRIVYSPLDCLAIASANPESRVVFLSSGFEPAVHPNAMAVWQARRMGLKNFFLLSYHLMASSVVPSVLKDSSIKIDGLLAPPDVCAITGTREFERISKEFQVPVVVCGYDPEDLLSGIEDLIDKMENGETGVEIQFGTSIRRAGDVEAQARIRESFVLVDATWRSLGEIPQSRFKLGKAFQSFDAENIFEVNFGSLDESPLCVSRDVLMGVRKPTDCTAFGKACTPGTPLGAPMACSDGTCALYYLQRNTADDGSEITLS